MNHTHLDSVLEMSRASEGKRRPVVCRGWRGVPKLGGQRLRSDGEVPVHRGEERAVAAAHGRELHHFFRGSFSAVSTPILASK